MVAVIQSEVYIGMYLDDAKQNLTILVGFCVAVVAAAAVVVVVVAVVAVVAAVAAVAEAAFEWKQLACPAEVL
jgi:hypothetical protein